MGWDAPLSFVEELRGRWANKGDGDIKVVDRGKPPVDRSIQVTDTRPKAGERKSK